MNHDLHFISQGVVCETPMGYIKALPQIIEDAGRTCYKTESKDPHAFMRMIIKRGHESVLEHGAITFRIICDRGVSHEAVRHRLSSFSQESTRYVNYSKKGVEMVNPFSAFPKKDSPELYRIWEKAMQDASTAYLAMIQEGAPPELARSVLPNAIKTELVWTSNPRQWRTIMKLRTSPAAHPQMREVAGAIFHWFRSHMPDLVSDMEYPERNQ